MDKKEVSHLAFQLGGVGLSPTGRTKSITMEDRENFTESEENMQRRVEVSSKFVKMGKALIIEGKNNDDFCVLSAGNLLILLSGLVINSKDMDEFNNLCSMFTAKNILDDMMKSPMGGMMMGGGLMDKLASLDGPFGDNSDDIAEILNFLKNSDKNGPSDFLSDDEDDEEER